LELKKGKDAEEKLWNKFIRIRKLLDAARKEYNERHTLETIENLDKTCIKFNNIFHSWQFTYDKKIRENSVYIPPHR